jgi:molecular chaperone DnaJ
MKKEKDYYEILNIDKDANNEEIKRAYRKLAKKYHPDVNKEDPKASEKFIEIKDAYETLIDPEKRKLYDKFGHNPKNIDITNIYQNNGFTNVQDIFREIFMRTRQNYYKPPPEGMYT